ncbi:hypothetical protein JXL19_08090 [bacterium]|nr:hypothetical protein [bacterium]
MKKTKRILIFTFFFVFYTFFGFLISGNCLIKPGDIFPEMSIDLTSYKTAKEYLKIKKGKEMDISKIDADLLLIEIMSVYCVSCMSQAPYDRELFSMIENNKATSGRVKMIGIGAGNNFREVTKFIEEFDVLYPVFPDPKFEKYSQIGQVRTPFKIYLLKQPDKKYRIIKTEMGLRDNVEATFSSIVDILEGRYSIDKDVEAASVEEKEMDQSEVETLLRGWLLMRGDSPDIERLFEESGSTVFKIGSKDDMFAVLINRVSTCDVCKSVRFIYMMDRLGNVMDIIPIQLSKLYNETFTELELNRVKTRLLSRNVRENISFDPEVDAITSATITSAILYDSMNKGKDIYNLLIEKGFI